MICPKCLSNNVSLQVQDIDHNSYFLYKSASKLVVLLGMLIRRWQKVDYGKVCTCHTCGNRWHIRQVAPKTRYREILEQYLGRSYSTIEIRAAEGASLKLSDSILTIFSEERNACSIPYEEISAVVYQKSLGPLHGWLSIRDRANKNLPFPRTYGHAKEDDYTIFYDYNEASSYQQIYFALDAVA